MTEPNKATPRLVLGNIVGWVGGWALSQYTGSSLWIPGGVAILMMVVFTKTSFKPRYFPATLAVLSGHLAWFLVGAIATGSWSALIFDLLLIAAGLAWLLARPGLAATLVVGAYGLFALIANLTQMRAVAVGSDDHKALTVHCVFRLLTLGTLVGGYLNFRKMEVVGASATSG